MILVDVYVPIMEETFDFNLDEKALISDLVVEMGEIICQKENWPKPKNDGNLLLCSVRSRHVLPEDSTLEGMGITSGSRLMLI